MRDFRSLGYDNGIDNHHSSGIRDANTLHDGTNGHGDDAGRCVQCLLVRPLDTSERRG
jgi:hypothetical protein